MATSPSPVPVPGPSPSPSPNAYLHDIPALPELAPFHPRFERSAWFRDARFGLFLHWGAYAVPARGEWVRSVERISLEEYQQYVDAFQPDAFDPRAWAASAKAAGMRYAVLTAKHHDGFALFESEFSDYTTQHTLGRDFVREYLEAFREAGLQVGLYFSVIDWSRGDYPHFGDLHHPMRDNEAFRDHRADLDTYVEYMHGQVRELCTNYGKLDILWFDFSYGEMSNETWRATDLIREVRSLQPGVIVDNRLETSAEAHGSLLTDSPREYCGDFVSPEQLIPSQGILCDDGSPAPWEACITLNNHWGYARDDADYKSADMVIRKIIECAAKGGNLLLNVGPDERGRFTAQSEECLRRVGDWMRDHGEAIYGTREAGLEKPEWGYYTRRGDTVYAHILLPSIGPLALTGGLHMSQIECVSLVGDDGIVKLSQDWVTKAYEGTPYLQFGENPSFTYPLPNSIATVVRIDLRRAASPRA